MSKPDRRLANARSERGYHRWERPYLCWGRGEWNKVDRSLRRIERRAAKDSLREEYP